MGEITHLIAKVQTIHIYLMVNETVFLKFHYLVGGSIREPNLGMS